MARVAAGWKSKEGAWCEEVPGPSFWAAAHDAAFSVCGMGPGAYVLLSS